MGAGWIAKGPDQPLPSSQAPADPWTPVGPDTASVPALVRPHQDPNAHPVDNTRGLFTQAKDLFFGHEPTDANDPDQAHVASPWEALAATAKDKDTPLGATVDWAENRALAPGPSNSALATAFPHLFGAQLQKIKAGVQETVGASQYQEAERALAALNVLPQVAARAYGPNGGPQSSGVPGMDMGADAQDAVAINKMAKDPAVKAQAIKLGIAPEELASDWHKYSDMTPDQQADAMRRAQDLLNRGAANKTAGEKSRGEALATETAWQPTDLENGKLDPMSLRGMAFNTALAIPALATTAAAATAGTAVGGPALGVAAGGATATALFAPQQVSDIRNKIDAQISQKLEQADQIDKYAPVGQKRGLSPQSSDLRQQAADLAKNQDQIANTAGLLYAVSDAAGAVPVSAVLSKSPIGKAMLDRMVGSAVSQTMGGRIAGSMVANGAGGMLQASIQKAVDSGIVHENTSLTDALKDIAFAGVNAAITAAPVAAVHEAIQAPSRARAQAQDYVNSDQALNTVRTEFGNFAPEAPTEPGAEPASAPGGPSAATAGGDRATTAPQGATTAPEGGAAAARADYQAKIDKLNEAAASAEKRSDVSLQPEEDGWSVHVNGQEVARFDNAQTAREAMAQARKRVGTKPQAAPAEPTPAPETPKPTPAAPAESAASAAPTPAETAAEAPSAAQRPAVMAMPAPTEEPASAPEREPETALERTQPIQSERRSNLVDRSRFETMTPEERLEALNEMHTKMYQHELTGIPNKRAYDESPKKATQVSVDADSLKWFNSQGSHEGGDQLLKVIAQAGHEQSPGNFYHKGGDEFVLQADSPQEAEGHMAAIKERLNGATIEMTAPDGRKLTVRGIGVTHGTGKTFLEADRAMEQEKAARTARGERAGRDQQPPGATFAAPEAGVPSDEGHAPAQALTPQERAQANARLIVQGLGQNEKPLLNPHARGEMTELAGQGVGSQPKVLGQPIERLPDVPTPKQAQAGNYFKPEVNWHGIPIKVENAKGQSRGFIDATTGKPGTRVMKADYGYVPGTKGADQDGVDIMMGPHPESTHAYVIDQLDHTGNRFDEHKVQVGVRSEKEARQQYLAHYPKDWKGLGAITKMEPGELQDWLKHGHLDEPVAWRPELHNLIADPDVAERLKAMANETGWAEKGGSIIRKSEDPSHIDYNTVVGRTQWLPHHPWFKDLQEKLPEGTYKDAIEKAIAGKPLGAKQQRVISQMARIAHEQVEQARKNPASADWRMPLSDEQYERLSLSQTQTRISQLEAEQERLERERERAGMNEPAEAEREDDIPFARPPGRGPGVQQDLFGAINHVQNELKKAEAALDKKRNSGQESVETGDPGDLFSQARKQVDLEDLTKGAPATVANPLGDAGEKIGGARKDRWAERGMALSDLSSMTDTEAAHLVTKKAVFNPDWGKLIASGMPKEVAALAKVLTDQLAAKPRYNTPTGRQHYVETLGKVRDWMLAAKSVGEIKAIQQRLVDDLKMPTGYALASSPEQKEAREKFWSIQKGRRSTLGVHPSDERKAEELLASGWPAKKAREVPEGGEPPKTRDKEPTRPHLDAINRVGPPVRAGDVASQDFIRDLGMRGLEFGNYAANDERQRLLNHAYEGLMDLARILNVPPKALSLNGTLGLALGARGMGAVAHYEPSKLVINMAKVTGAGALAHEWGHALDHYMGELNRPDAYSTDPRGATGWRGDRRDLKHLRPELQEAWNGVMAAMFHRDVTAAEAIRDGELNLENLQARRRELENQIAAQPNAKYLIDRRAMIDDRIRQTQARIADARANPEKSFGRVATKFVRGSERHGNYWRRPTEMFARAFESFVHDRLKAAGEQSDYLVHGTEPEHWESMTGKGNPYPKEDRPAINLAMQRLVDAIETQAGENGNVVMFARPDKVMDLDAGTAQNGEYQVNERARKGKTAPGQMDIFANAAAPKPANAAMVAKPTLSNRVVLKDAGVFHTGHARIDSWQQAAHVLAPLRKSPQEIMAALVVDRHDKPLAVIQHSLGMVDSANVETWSLAGAVAQVPGASQVYFAHNHPSGRIEQSNADRMVQERLESLLRGSGIEPHGMIVVAPGSAQASFYAATNHADELGAIAAAGRSKGMVPVKQRVIAKIGAKLGTLSSPKDAERFIKEVIAKGTTSGVVLLDVRHNVVGVIPMDDAAMRTLRTEDTATGSAHLLRTIAEANSKALVAFGDEAGVTNVLKFAQAAGVHALDGFAGNATYPDLIRSMAYSDEIPRDSNFYARPLLPAASHMAGPQVEAQVRELLKPFAVQPKGIVVAKTLAELQADPEIGKSIAGERDGNVIAFYHPKTQKLYFVADQITSPTHLTGIVAHEYVTHFGLRAKLGSPENAKYQAILDGVVAAMPGEVRARGEQAFGDAYNHFDRRMRNIAAEEALAYADQAQAERGTTPGPIRAWLDKWRQWIRDAWRRLWGYPKAFDDLWVRNTTQDLRDFLKRGRAMRGVAESQPAYAEKPDTFFSALARAVDAAKREKGTGAEWEATLRNMPGVKPEELQWTGLKDWLTDRGRVTKAEVAEYVAAHRVQVHEVLKGDSGQEVQPGLTDEQIDHIQNQLEYLGLGDLTADQRYILEDGGPDAAAMLNDFDARLRLHLEDIPRGTSDEEANTTKFGSYVAPGGKNYRELLLTLPTRNPVKPLTAAENGELIGLETLARTDQALTPQQRQRWQELDARHDAYFAQESKLERQQFRGSHWDEPNVLAHVRFDDREGPHGERILHLAEVQSDWHQKGRREGYGQGKVPEAPFKTTWPELAMKRMLRYAAENGYDALTWDTGATNADRYNIRKQVEAIQYEPDIQHLVGLDASGRSVVNETRVPPEKLPDYVGKEVADRLLQSERDAQGYHTLTGQQLEIGGAGMKSFYDKMLPATVGKLVKKWGAKVEQGGLPSLNNNIIQYRGPELGQLDILQAIKSDYPVVIQHQLQEIAGLVGQGMSLKDAMERAGSHATATALGGKLKWERLPVQFPAHMVKITPAMRDSVMQGQPLFARPKPFGANDGEEERKTPAVRGAYGLARRAIAAIPNNELVMSIRRIVDPANVSEYSKATANVTREALGGLAQASEEALKNLEEYARLFDRLGTDDRYAFIDAMETGSKQANRELQSAADAIRQALDHWREEIRGLGVGALENFIENYFPHIWADDAKAKKAFAQIFGRRPLKGPATFLKQRTIPTTAEGLALGLKPISTNPLVLAFAKIREMQRFYTGVKLMQRFKDEGLAKFLPAGKMRPEDWAEINDAVGRVRQWSEIEQGFVERGHYIMPVDAARVINNHLGHSALRNFVPAQVFRAVSNAANALQLGFSAFHLGFTTLDAIVSKNALAIERMWHGEPLRAAAALLESSSLVGGFGMNLVRGRKLLKAYANLSGATPEMQKIVQGLIAAGGRVKMDNYYMASRGLSPFDARPGKAAGAAIGSAIGGVTAGLPGAIAGSVVGGAIGTLAHELKLVMTQPHASVWEATKTMGSFPREYATRLWRDFQEMWELEPLKVLPLQTALEIAGRSVRGSTAVIMEHIVPLQKLGVFSDLAADHIRRNPGEDPVAFAHAMQQIWNSVDNRLGELVYDNLFWNRTFKEVNHITVRAVGWNLGTVRELGGAPVDTLKVLDYVLRGAPPELPAAPLSKTAQARLDYEAQKSKWQRIAEKAGHRISYTVALIATSMILGALLTKAFSGKDPEETKDYFFPWTGRWTKYGTKERMSMPAYTKDIFEYAEQPGTTIINKANPLFGIIHSLYADEDFFGSPVYNPNNPDGFNLQNLKDGIAYGMREVAPFAIQGAKQFEGAGEDSDKAKLLRFLPEVGFTPAPARITSPEVMEHYEHDRKERAWGQALRRQLKQAEERGDTVEVERLKQEVLEQKLKQRESSRDIKTDKQKAMEASKKISLLIEGRSREDAAGELERAGLPAFAALWRSLPDQPRARVAQSLETYA